MSETLPTTATGADEKEKAFVTQAHDTRQGADAFSATIDFSKQQAPESGPEKAATLEQSAAEAAPENPTVVVAGLERERGAVNQQLEAIDLAAAKTGKPLEHSAFLDRAGLFEKAVTLDILTSQKKLALAEASPEAATPAGQAEIERLKKERKEVIEGLKAQVDAQIKETRKRAATELMAEDTDLSILSANRLVESMPRQEQLRAKLEAAGMTPEEIKATVAEAIAESPEEQKDTAQGERMEFAITQLRADGAGKEAGPTEKVDDNLRVALANFAEVVATIAARSADPKEKSLFEAVVENLKRLSELGAAKLEKNAKTDIRELLGVSVAMGGQQEVTGAALDKFTKGMEDDKKGKGGSFFKNLMGKIGQLSWVKKGREFFKGIGTRLTAGAEFGAGLAKLGGGAVKARLEGLLKGQFGPLDLGKKVAATTETAPAAGVGNEAAPVDDLESVRSKLQALNARMDAYDIANPGKRDSQESRAMEAEYAPLRARFDELNKTAAPEAASVAPETSSAAVDIEAASVASSEAVKAPPAFEAPAELPEQPTAEQVPGASIAEPESVRSPAAAAEGQPSSAEAAPIALPGEIMSDLEGPGAEAASRFNTGVFAGLSRSDTGSVDALLASAWEGVDSARAELVKNRILYHTLTKEPNIPDAVKPYILETLQNRGYLTYREENGRYTFNRPRF